jgi:hypothetical protein
MKNRQFDLVHVRANRAEAGSIYDLLVLDPFGNKMEICCRTGF